MSRFLANLAALPKVVKPHHYVYGCIIGLFAITIHGLAFFFQTLEGTDPLMIRVSYLEAGIFDLAVLGISALIRQIGHDSQRQHRRWKCAGLWLLITACILVSVIGNLAYVLTHAQFGLLGSAEHLPWAPAYPYIGACLPILTLVFTLVAQMITEEVLSADQLRERNAQKLALLKEKTEFARQRAQIVPKADGAALITAAKTTNMALRTLFGRTPPHRDPIYPRVSGEDHGNMPQQPYFDPQTGHPLATATPEDEHGLQRAPDDRQEEQTTEDAVVLLPTYSPRQTSYEVAGRTYVTYRVIARQWGYTENQVKQACLWAVEQEEDWCLPLPYLQGHVYLVDTKQKLRMRAAIKHLEGKGILRAIRTNTQGTQPKEIHLVPTTKDVPHSPLPLDKAQP